MSETGASVGYTKPLPTPTSDSREFWESCRRHELRLPRCQACGQLHYFPRKFCPFCHSDALEWVPVSGRGTIFSFSEVHVPFQPEFADEVPYVAIVVELAEGPRLMSRVVDCPNDALRVGLPVEIVYDDVTPEVTLPKFRPTRGEF